MSGKTYGPGVVTDIRLQTRNLVNDVMPNEKQQKVIRGVSVTFYSTENQENSWEYWQNVIDEALEPFANTGMLRRMKHISIGGKGAPTGEAVGMYNSGHVMLDNDTSTFPSGVVLEDSPEFVLTHELIHHVHLTLNDFDDTYGSLSEREETLLSRAVSLYSKKNKAEAVAEIGAGILHGYSFEDFVHEIYAKYDGPQFVYEV